MYLCVVGWIVKWDIPESYSGTREWDLIWIYMFCRCNEIGGIPYLESALNQTSDVLKRESRRLEIYKQRRDTERNPHEGEGKDWRYAAPNQEMLKVDGIHQTPGERHDTDSVRLQSEPILPTNPSSILSFLRIIIPEDNPEIIIFCCFKIKSLR